MSQINDSYVLFVEDDQLISDLIGQKFLSENISIKHTPTGEVALEILKSDPKPKLILLDIRLPGIDGFEVLKRIKEDESTKNIPVVVFSNFDEEGDKERAKTLGAEDYFVKVTKPPDELVQWIHDRLKSAT